MSKRDKKGARRRRQREREARLARRGVRIIKDASGETVGYDVPVPPELAEIFDRLEGDYRRLHGREVPEGMSLRELGRRSVSSQTEYVNGVMQAMVKAGVDLSLVYAFWRSGGVLPTEQNIDLIPEERLAAFEQFRQEYESKVERGEDPWANG